MGFSLGGDGFVVVAVLVVFGVIGVCINGENYEDEAAVMGAPMAKTEQEALYSAIQGFVGKWWNVSDLYPDPCGWTPIQGVSCDLFDGFWYVTGLNIGPIHENSIPCAPNPEFTPHFFQLTHIKSLTFFNCFISPSNPIPPATWAAFSGSMESLEFRSNPGLSGGIPADFGQLHNLQSLVAIDNGFSGSLPDKFGNLGQLKRLVLAGNKISGGIPDGYGDLGELLILDLSRNSLSGAVPLTFGRLTSLLKLDLSRNQLHGRIPSEISNMKNLTLLDLSRNKFSGGLTTAVQEMGSLEELVLANNPIGGGLEGFQWANLRGLVVLDLSNTRLTGGVPESISGLKRLRFLGLKDNGLAGNLPVRLAELRDLNAVYVQGNELAGALGFGPGFYRRLGRRFGAWNNSNLCFPTGSVPVSVSPFGVKPCRREVDKKS